MFPDLVLLWCGRSYGVQTDSILNRNMHAKPKALIPWTIHTQMSYHKV